jgi:hypothetical protein
MSLRWAPRANIAPLRGARRCRHAHVKSSDITAYYDAWITQVVTLQGGLFRPRSRTVRPAIWRLLRASERRCEGGASGDMQSRAEIRCRLTWALGAWVFACTGRLSSAVEQRFCKAQALVLPSVAPCSRLRRCEHFQGSPCPAILSGAVPSCMVRCQFRCQLWSHPPAGTPRSCAAIVGASMSVRRDYPRRRSR